MRTPTRGGRDQEMIEMQFVMSVIDDRTGSGTAEEAVAIDAFNDRMKADGQWVFAAGLDAPGTSVVVDNRGGKGLVTDGPFLESKEHFAGLWIIEAADLGTARALAVDASLACNRKVELRPILG